MYLPLNSAQIQQAVVSLLAYALPWLGLVLPGYLKRDGLGVRGNALISGFIILTVSGLQAYGAGKLGLNPVADFLAVSGGLAALLNGPLKPLDQWLQSNIGIGAGDTKVKVQAFVSPLTAASPSSIQQIPFQQTSVNPQGPGTLPTTSSSSVQGASVSAGTPPTNHPWV